ncbi:uncharacterized protein LOC110433577 [Sorghum bicolor]|uniref:Uncharacterized protein n=1 Tax=Sorghum bicolor TaxID=4558 RepID=C5XHM4_SORBI|nr:uncharacterized protein LOC110433577 [Sorghum bicolor]EES01344.2 hypothetical protein SORBI_3003G271700 [Sorghum bicolor]|eukprot:XP_021311665.1 uncharacterized protein LOC110433577 [Sorghum bicolor]
MSTSLCYAALTAATPSARGGGVRRLPGRCGRAAGGAGSRGVRFTLSFMAPPPKPEVTKLVMCAEKPRIRKSTDPWPLDNDYKEDQDAIDKFYADLSKKLEYFRSFGDEDDDFDKYYASLCKQTEAAITGKLSDLIPLMPVLSEEEKAVQNKVKEIAERCMDLQADAMRRLRPEQRRPLYLLFRTTHLAFESVKVRAMEGHANWGVSSLLVVHKLDVVRKMVSSACSAPLPLDRDKKELSLLPPLVQETIGGLLVGADSKPEQEVTFAFVEYTYNTVKSDIDEMITASATSTS